MAHPRHRILTLLLLASLAATAEAQPAPSLSKSAEAIKRKADSLAAHAPISVVRIHAPEQFGEFLASDTQTFTFHDIDRNVDVTLSYTEVRKIKDGYGGYNSLRGTHTDRNKVFIVVAIVAAGLVADIVLAAAAK